MLHQTVWRRRGAPPSIRQRSARLPSSTQPHNSSRERRLTTPHVCTHTGQTTAHPTPTPCPQGHVSPHVDGAFCGNTEQARTQVFRHRQMSGNNAGVTEGRTAGEGPQGPRALTNPQPRKPRMSMPALQSPECCHWSYTLPPWHP